MEIKNELNEPPGVSNKIKEIPLQSYIPRIKENYFFYDNGLSKFIPKIKVKVHHGIEDCYFLWEKFSPNNSIFNLWEFREAWYQGFQYQPFFYSLYLEKNPLAVLPLWFNRIDKRYEWFGGTWPEDNHFFVKEEKFIPLLFKIIPQPIYLNAIIKENIDEKILLINFLEDSPKYVLKIKNKTLIDEAIANLKKKHRYNLRYFYNHYLALSPKIKILLGDQSHLLPELKKLSIIDFERNDISEYRKKERVKTFEMIYKNQGRYQILTYLVYIQNRLAVYDILGIYKKNFYILTGASDLSRFPGIGVFITYLEFQEALKRQMDLIDCMQEDYNWKHKYFFPHPMLKFEKK